MSGRQSDISVRFAKQLVEWSRSGKEPECANSDVRYFLDLQEARQKERGIRMEYELTMPVKVEELVAGSTFRSKRRQSIKYESNTDFQNYTRKLTFFRGDKKCFLRKKDEILYVTATDIKTNKMSGEEAYCCPNCGAVSTIQKLQDGCPYCQTRFMMSDLFPKVTEFMFAPETGERAGKLKVKIGIFMLFAAAIMAGLNFFLNVGENSDTELVLAVIGGAVGGAILGYFVWAIGKFVSIMGQAVGSLGPLARQQEAKRKLTTLLSGFDPSFSYDYFLNRLVSSIKIILFAKDRRNLIQYVGQELHPEFDDIIEANMNGRIALNNYRVQDGYCAINMNIGMDVIHDGTNRIYQKRETFVVTILKNVTVPEELGFSIRAVKCRNCGSSFDATKMRHCPQCGTPYDLRQDAWVVTQIFKV